MFRLIFWLLPVLNLFWWVWAHQRARGARLSRWWRIGAALFALSQLAGYAWVIASRYRDMPDLPAALVALLYIWNLVVLPIALGVAVLDIGIRTVLRWMKQRPLRENATASPVPTDDAPFYPTRRQVIASGLIAAAPALAGAGVIRSAATRSEFRIRRVHVPLSALPPALDGMTIAHVSDTHVGRFTRGGMLDRIADATNELKADLVLFTGDLIDYSLDDLPAALEMLRKIDPRDGMYLCEGNHDLFQNPRAFEEGVARAGVPLLLNESTVVFPRNCPVQILGIRWGIPGAAGWTMDDHLRETLRQRQLDAFPILLAHHPHAFDAAADAGIPLTLAGHTHGGQLMLTPGFGAGSLMFKYWSGLYRRRNAALVVSNGVGNWFPLRVNAPAEIIHLTLHRA